MPTTAKTLKALRESLKTLQTQTREDERKHQGTRLGLILHGRVEGVEMARRIVETLCQ